MTNNNPICLFDSGIGGLTVLKKLIETFPRENYIYLADLANVPFGDKTKEEINKIVKEIMEWLIKFNPKLIIMACNTSSALVLEEYKSKLNVPIYGVIESCAKEIAGSKYKKVSLWATNLVVKSNAYKNAIQKLNSSISVEEIACPKLVPMIESLSPIDNNEKDNIVREYLGKTSHSSDALILGCTHYPLIEHKLSKLTNMKLIDPASSLINELTSSLLLKNNSLSNSVALYTTAQPDKLQKFANLYLCGEFKVSLINLKKATV